MQIETPKATMLRKNKRIVAQIDRQLDIVQTLTNLLTQWHLYYKIELSIKLVRGIFFK